MVVCASHDFPNLRSLRCNGARLDVRTVATYYRPEGSLSCRGGIILFCYSA